MTETHTFTPREEVANAITHGLGVILSLAGLIFLIVHSASEGSVWHVVTFTIYGVTMLFLYIASTTLHSLQHGKAKDIFEILDHTAIYHFIAGTYTPILLIVVQGTVGWVLFGIVWGLAIGGTVFKVFFVKRFLIVSTVLYIMMGWLIVFVFPNVLATLPTAAIWLLVIGGLFYTVGALFYVWRFFTYHHAVWHLFVLAGTVCHFFVIYGYVTLISR